MEADKEKSVVEYWLKCLRKEEKCHAGFRKLAEKAERAYYSDDTKKDGKQIFPLFWSNTQVQHAALYQKTPNPIVGKRNTARDVNVKRLALAIEQSLRYGLDVDDFDTPMHKIIDDYLIPGIGVGWVDYDVSLDELGNIAWQKVRLSHISWKNFHWEPACSWDLVDWIGIDRNLSLKDIEKEYGAEVLESLNVRTKTTDEKYENTYRVTEVWYRPTRMIYVVGWDFSKLLEVRKDRRDLQGFFPCPMPLFSNPKGDELIPTPEYKFGEHQYAYINTLTERISKLTRQIKDVGFYDSQLADLAKLVNASDGDLVPIKDLIGSLHMAEGARNFDAVVAKMPIQEKVTVVQNLIQLREQAKNNIFEIFGTADIVRGVSDPNETASAQQIKAQWANARLALRGNNIQRFIRDVFRIMAETIGEHFTPQVIYLMTGEQFVDEELAYLRTDINRSFAIDVETESTVAADDAIEKEARLEMVNTMTNLLPNVLQGMQSGLLPADLGVGVLKTAIAAFKFGRDLEDAIDALPDNQKQLMAMTQQLQQAAQQIQTMQAQQQEMQQVNAQLQTQVAQVNERDEARKDLKAQTDATGRQAEAEKDQSTKILNMTRAQAQVQQAQAIPLIG